MILVLTGLSVVLPAGLKGLNNAGPHGLSEILYAFTSTPANNGSAFAGLTGSTYYYNTLFGFATLIGRFAMMVPMLAAAGFLAEKQHRAGVGRDVPGHDAAVRGAPHQRHPDRRRAHVLPGALARPDRRAPADAEREALLAWPSPSARSSIRRSSGGRCSDAFVKLAPRHMVRNPVMFVVLVGSVFTTFVLVRDVAPGRAGLGLHASSSRSGSGSRSCSPTSPRRWRRGAARRRPTTLRKTRTADAWPSGCAGPTRHARASRACPSSDAADAATWCCAARATSSRATARSSTASRRWTSRRSPASRAR